MPGYNHYSNCACGWCVNYGRSHVDRRRVLSELRLGDARSLLRRNSVNSVAGCFVNPNARCPVCEAPVFFYANSFGSRVFFDDLGPPWPKHPCTDNPRYSKATKDYAASAPVRRAKGITQELIAAANAVGRLRNKEFSRRLPEDWTLLAIISVERHGAENKIAAEFLDSHTRETFRFRCFSAEPVFQAGDFINKKGNEISFVHPVTLAPVTFRTGSTISITYDESAPSRSAAPHDDRSPKQNLSGDTRLIPAGAKKANVKTRKGEKRLPSGGAMTEDEMIHFHSDAVSIADLCESLGPVVESCINSGMRKPGKIARVLNNGQYRTACGGEWSSRLVRFLMALVLRDHEASPKRSGVQASRKGESKQTTSNAGAGRSIPRGPVTRNELISRLSTLGRVVVGR